MDKTFVSNIDDFLWTLQPALIASLGETTRLGEQMKIKITTISLAFIAVTGCAKRPDAIVPVDIPLAAYSGLNCKGIAQETIAENNKLAALSKAQNSAATGDAVGVFLLGVPVSSVTGGDKEGMIAVSKGKVQALENASRAKGCNKSS
jgi:hypothetical protein